MPAVFDTFLPTSDVRERHEIVVRAPAELVFQVARRFDMLSVPLVHAIFWLRAKVMRARHAGQPRLVRLDSASLVQMGWGVLVEEPGRLFIAGAACQPWRADVVFAPVAPAEFAAYAAPDSVKIAWSLETQPLGAGSTRLATETRAVGTDAGARAKFRRYWRWARVGIVAIRWLLLPAIRREAERA
ncbi:MAG: hypothetical protein ACJ8DC_13445 [Gemmatimonadales bacterium]